MSIFRIDPHVHFRDDVQNYKETIRHGLKLASDQGVKYVFDMPNTAIPILTENDVIKRLNMVPESEKERYFLYIGATSDEEQLRDAIRVVLKYREVVGLKMFAGQSTGNLAIISEDEQQKIYTILAQNNYTGVIAVHCEKESFMTNTFDPKDPISHAKSRPNIAEVESLKDQINFAKKAEFKGKLHICHISCKDAAQLVSKTKDEGILKISCGITPHHLMWDESKMQDSDHGLLYKMNPPLRSLVDVEFLHIALKENVIDCIETDHAPHTIGEKLYDGYPSGFPSLYLYKKLTDKFLPELGLTKEQIDNLTFNNIVKIFDLNLKKD